MNGIASPYRREGTAPPADRERVRLLLVDRDATGTERVEREQTADDADVLP